MFGVWRGHARDNLNTFGRVANAEPWRIVSICSCGIGTRLVYGFTESGIGWANTGSLLNGRGT